MRSNETLPTQSDELSMSTRSFVRKTRNHRTLSKQSNPPDSESPITIDELSVVTEIKRSSTPVNHKLFYGMNIRNPEEYLLSLGPAYLKIPRNWNV